MGALLWVKVPSRVDHNERSEAQLHEGDRVWGGSVERSCGPMNKNRIEGGADQGERARNREALVAAPKLAEILVKIKPTSLLLTLATQVQRTVDLEAPDRTRLLLHAFRKRGVVELAQRVDVASEVEAIIRIGIARTVSIICRLPLWAPASLRRTRSIAAGSIQSLKGAPLRKALGLRASTGT